MKPIVPSDYMVVIFTATAGQSLTKEYKIISMEFIDPFERRSGLNIPHVVFKSMYVLGQTEYPR